MQVLKKNKLSASSISVKYAITVALIFAAVYFPILLDNKIYMYLDIGADTYAAYWPRFSAVYNALKEGTIWSESIGLGNTFLTYSSFLFDPFNLFVYPFLTDNIEVGLFLSLVAKNIVLAVISFLYFRKLNFTDGALVCGALSVTFSGYMVCWGQHYNFASYFVIFVAMVYTVERWLQNHHCWRLLLGSVAVALAISIYLSYMAAIFLGVYTVVRYVQIHGVFWNKKLLHSVVQMVAILAGAALVSLFSYYGAFVSITGNSRMDLSSFSLQPTSFEQLVTTLVRVLSNTALGVQSPFVGWNNFYESPFLYCGVLVAFSLPIMLYYGKHRKLIIWGSLLFALFLFMPTPFAQVFNMFKTEAYRWTFILVPVSGLLIACAVKLLQEKTETVSPIVPGTTCVAIFLILAILLTLFEQKGIIWTDNKVILISLMVLVFVSGAYFLIIQLPYRGESVENRFAEKALIVLLCLELTANGYISVNCRQLISKEQLKTLHYTDDSSLAAEYLESIDDGYYRINKKYHYEVLNESMVQGYNGEKFYGGLSRDLAALIEDLDLHVSGWNWFYGFEDKQAFRDVSAGKYMFTKDGRTYDGYNLVNKVGDVYIYENINAFPVGTVFDSVITLSEYNSLDYLEKQEVLYTSLIVSDDFDTSSYKKIDIEGADYSPLGEEIEVKASLFDSKAYIWPKEKTDSRTILAITGGTGGISGKAYIKTTKHEKNEYDIINVEVSAGKTKYYNVLTLDVVEIMLAGSYSSSEEVAECVKLYTYDGISESQDLITSREYIDFTKITDGYFSGSVELDEPGIALIPTNFSEDWVLYVDGVEQEQLKVNYIHMGIPLESGMHDVVLKYVPKTWYTACIISGVSMVAVLLVSYFSRKKNFVRK